MAVGALWKTDKSKLRMKPMHTFLPPIEKPTGLMKKLVFAMTRRQVGKVLTPLKVFTARLPLRFGQFYAKVSQLDKKLLLSPWVRPGQIKDFTRFSFEARSARVRRVRLAVL